MTYWQAFKRGFMKPLPLWMVLLLTYLIGVLSGIYLVKIVVAAAS